MEKQLASDLGLIAYQLSLSFLCCRSWSDCYSVVHFWVITRPKQKDIHVDFWYSTNSKINCTARGKPLLATPIHAKLLNDFLAFLINLNQHILIQLLVTYTQAKIINHFHVIIILFISMIVPPLSAFSITMISLFLSFFRASNSTLLQLLLEKLCSLIRPSYNQLSTGFDLQWIFKVTLLHISLRCCNPKASH